jgi:hypothetical protein
MIYMLGAINAWPAVRCLYDYGFDSLLWGHAGQKNRISVLQRVETLWGPAPLWVRFAFLTGTMPRRLTLSNDQKKQWHVLGNPLFLSLDAWALPENDWPKNRHDVWLAALNSVYQYGLMCTKERLWMVALHAVADFGQVSVGHDEDSTPEAADAWAVKGQGSEAKVLRCCQDIMAALDRTHFPEFSLTGRDVMAFGVSGPDIGRVLNETKAWWIGAEMRPSHEECLAYGKNLVDGSGGSALE